MTSPWVQGFRARWADMDFNQHMRNAAFLGCAEETRMGYLDDGGFSMARFQELKLGPVVLEDRLTYNKELRLLEPFHVDLQLAGMTEDGRRMKVRNQFTRDKDSALCAVVDSVILWFDLAARRPVVPPPALRALWRALPQTADFEVLPSRPS